MMGLKKQMEALKTAIQNIKNRQTGNATIESTKKFDCTEYNVDQNNIKPNIIDVFLSKPAQLTPGSASFPGSQNHHIISMMQWQYWWWFWFSMVVALVYTIASRLTHNRLSYQNPKIVTSYRSHGRWGDLIICLIPVFWCVNILSSSHFLLRALEWQTETSPFTLRVRGKQWYWIYKFDLNNATHIDDLPKLIGYDKKVFFQKTNTTRHERVLKTNRFKYFTDTRQSAALEKSETLQNREKNYYQNKFKLPKKNYKYSVINTFSNLPDNLIKIINFNNFINRNQMLQKLLLIGLFKDIKNVNKSGRVIINIPMTEDSFKELKDINWKIVKNLTIAHSLSMQNERAGAFFKKAVCDTLTFMRLSRIAAQTQEYHNYPNMGPSSCNNTPHNTMIKVLNSLAKIGIYKLQRFKKDVDITTGTLPKFRRTHFYLALKYIKIAEKPINKVNEILLNYKQIGTLAYNTLEDQSTYWKSNKPILNYRKIIKTRNILNKTLCNSIYPNYKYPHIFKYMVNTLFDDYLTRSVFKNKFEDLQNYYHNPYQKKFKTNFFNCSKYNNLLKCKGVLTKKLISISNRAGMGEKTDKIDYLIPSLKQAVLTKKTNGIVEFGRHFTTIKWIKKALTEGNVWNERLINSKVIHSEDSKDFKTYNFFIFRKSWRLITNPSKISNVVHYLHKITMDRAIVLEFYKNAYKMHIFGSHLFKDESDPVYRKWLSVIKKERPLTFNEYKHVVSVIFKKTYNKQTATLMTKNYITSDITLKAYNDLVGNKWCKLKWRELNCQRPASNFWYPSNKIPSVIMRSLTTDMMVYILKKERFPKLSPSHVVIFSVNNFFNKVGMVKSGKFSDHMVFSYYKSLLAYSHGLLWFKKINLNENSPLNYVKARHWLVGYKEHELLMNVQKTMVDLIPYMVNWNKIPGDRYINNVLYTKLVYMYIEYALRKLLAERINTTTLYRTYEIFLKNLLNKEFRHSNKKAISNLNDQHITNTKLQNIINDVNIRSIYKSVDLSINKIKIQHMVKNPIFVLSEYKEKLLLKKIATKLMAVNNKKATIGLLRSGLLIINKFNVDNMAIWNKIDSIKMQGWNNCILEKRNLLKNKLLYLKKVQLTIHTLASMWKKPITKSLYNYKYNTNKTFYTVVNRLDEIGMPNYRFLKRVRRRFPNIQASCWVYFEKTRKIKHDFKGIFHKKTCYIPYIKKFVYKKLTPHNDNKIFLNLMKIASNKCPLIVNDRSLSPYDPNNCKLKFRTKEMAFRSETKKYLISNARHNLKALKNQNNLELWFESEIYVKVKQPLLWLVRYFLSTYRTHYTVPALKKSRLALHQFNTTTTDSFPENVMCGRKQKALLYKPYEPQILLKFDNILKKLDTIDFKYTKNCLFSLKNNNLTFKSIISGHVVNTNKLFNRWTKTTDSLNGPIVLIKSTKDSNYPIGIRFSNNTKILRNSEDNTNVTIKQKKIEKTHFSSKLNQREISYSFEKNNKSIIRLRNGAVVLDPGYKDEFNYDFKEHYRLYNEMGNSSRINKSYPYQKRLLWVSKQILLPTHTAVTIVTNSYDVIHSWFIPGLGLKMDCVPGRSTHHTIYIEHTGYYYGQCAEVCGRRHHHMPIKLLAVPLPHFIYWWKKNIQPDFI